MAKISFRIDDKNDTFITAKAKKMGMNKSDYLRSIVIANNNTISDHKITFYENVETQLNDILMKIKNLSKIIDFTSNNTLLGNQLICQLLMQKYSSEELTKLVANLQSGLGIKGEDSHEHIQ